MATTTDRDLIEGTISNLEEVRVRLALDRDHLNERAADLDQKIEEVDDRIAKWRRQLAALENTQGNGAPRMRRKKGEGVGLVRAVLEQQDGLRMKEVAERAAIPWSSARNALHKNPALFEERDERWYLRKADEE